MAMFQEDLGSKEHLPIVPPPTEILAESERMRRPATAGSAGGDSSRKNSVKRKPVGSAPSLPKLNLSSDNSSTENLVSSLKIQDDSSGSSKTTKTPTQARLRGPRQRPQNLSMHNIHVDTLPQKPQRQSSPPTKTGQPAKRKPVGGGPSSATSSGADSSSFTQSPPITPPPVPPKEMTGGQKKDRWSQQFADFPGVQGALEGNPLAMQVSPPRKHSASAEYDDSSDEDNDDDDNDEAFERRAIASGTIRGKNTHRCQDKRASLNHVRYWKYHVLKYSKDLYLTTNPDHEHLSRPVAPSYYVDLYMDPLKLVFNSMEQGAPEMTVTRTGNAFELIISCTSEGIIWSGTAIETQAQIFLPARKRPVKCRQYTYRDDYGVEWVIGNRLEYTTTYDVNRNPVGNYAKVSSKVYFFIRGEGGDDDDTILAVLRRRHPKHKRVLKENFSKFFDHEELKNNDTQPSSEVADDDADNEKIGWLYMLDTIVQQQQMRNQSHLWKIITAFTLAVSYNLRVEEKDKSFQQRFSNFRRKAIRSVNPH